MLNQCHHLIHDQQLIQSIEANCNKKKKRSEHAQDIKLQVEEIRKNGVAGFYAKKQKLNEFYAKNPTTAHQSENENDYYSKNNNKNMDLKLINTRIKVPKWSGKLWLQI